MKRRIAALIILFGAALSAGFIVSGSVSHRRETADATSLFKDIIVRPSLSESLPDTPRTTDLTLPYGNPALPAVEALAVNGAHGNATQEAASAIATELLAKNPDGPSLLAGKSSITAINPDDLAGNALAQSLANFNPESVKPQIPLSAIKVVDTNTPEALTAYLREFTRIITTNSPGAHFNPSPNSPAQLIPVAHVLEKTIKEFYELSVPVPLTTLHREEISLLTAEKNIISSIISAADDPLASLLALQMWPEVNNGFADLSQKLNDFIAKNHIKL